MGTIRSKRGVRRGEILERQGSRTSESFLPRTRPQLVDASLRAGARGCAHRATRKNRADFNRTINARMGLPRFGPHPANCGVVSVERVLSRDRAIPAVLHDQTV